jgi:hypothetical protein
MASSPEPLRQRFPWRVRQRLCDHLLVLPEMRTVARRNHVIGQVAQDHPGLHTVARQDSPQADLLEFVTGAYDYPGALQRLLEVLSYLYGSDERLEPIRQVISAVEPDDLLKSAERRSIVEMLTAVDPALIAGAFHYSTRTTLAEAGFELSDVAAIIARVEAFPAGVGRLPPLFDLVDYAAHRCPRVQRASLHEWMDEVSHRLGQLDRSAIDTICRATENRLVLDGRYFLVTEVRPDHGAPDRFFLAAWRQHEDEPEEMFYQADHPVGWDEAIETIHDLMRQLARVVEHTARARILELIVPRGLVTHSIDQWLVDQKLPSPIGTVYPLVLRSFDRLDDTSMHLDWGRNWAWLKEHGRSAGATAIREVHSHDPDVALSLRAALLREGPPAAVHMRRALPASDDLTADAFTAGILGGAPIMIWSRDDTTAEDLADWIHEACTDDLLNLPGQVFQLRLRALDDKEPAPVGSHVALVFDDHDRIPEKFRSRARLRSPQLRRQGSI